MTDSPSSARASAPDLRPVPRIPSPIAAHVPLGAADGAPRGTAVSSVPVTGRRLPARFSSSGPLAWGLWHPRLGPDDAVRRALDTGPSAPVGWLSYARRLSGAFPTADATTTTADQPPAIWSILSSPHLTPAMLRAMYWWPRQAGRADRLAIVATHPDTPPDVLELLAHPRQKLAPGTFLWDRLMENPALPPSVLRQLITTREMTREALERVAAHPHTPPEVLLGIDTMVRDPNRRGSFWDDTLEYALLINPQLPASSLDAWTEDVLRRIATGGGPHGPRTGERVALLLTHPNASANVVTALTEAMETAPAAPYWRGLLKTLPTLVRNGGALLDAQWVARARQSHHWGSTALAPPILDADPAASARSGWDALVEDAMALPPSETRDAYIGDLLAVCPGPLQRWWHRHGCPPDTIPRTALRRGLASPVREVRELSVRFMATATAAPAPDASTVPSHPVAPAPHPDAPDGVGSHSAPPAPTHSSPMPLPTLTEPLSSFLQSSEHRLALVGPPGSGMAYSTMQAAAAVGRSVHEIRCSQLTREEIEGVQLPGVQRALPSVFASIQPQSVLVLTDADALPADTAEALRAALESAAFQQLKVIVIGRSVPSWLPPTHCITTTGVSGRQARVAR